MLRSEFLISGCLLVFAGLALVAVGYNKTQPTVIDNAVGFLEQLSGQSAPADLKTDKSSGYLMMAGGAAGVVIGLGLVLNSRCGTSGNQQRKDRG